MATFSQVFFSRLNACTHFRVIQPPEGGEQLIEALTPETKKVNVLDENTSDHVKSRGATSASRALPGRKTQTRDALGRPILFGVGPAESNRPKYQFPILPDSLYDELTNVKYNISNSLPLLLRTLKKKQLTRSTGWAPSKRPINPAVQDNDNEEQDDLYIDIESVTLEEAELFDTFKDLSLVDSPMQVLDKRLSTFERLEELTLTGNQLSHVDNLPSKLQYLCVNANKISEAPKLSHCLHLVHVGLSHNQLVKLDSSSTIFPPSLKSLDISYNLFTHVSDFCTAIVKLPNLKLFSALGNPCCMLENYRYSLLHELSNKKLTTLDDQPITDSDREMLEVLIQRGSLNTTTNTITPFQISISRIEGLLEMPSIVDEPPPTAVQNTPQVNNMDTIVPATAAVSAPNPIPPASSEPRPPDEFLYHIEWHFKQLPQQSPLPLSDMTIGFPGPLAVPVAATSTTKESHRAGSAKDKHAKEAAPHVPENTDRELEYRRAFAWPITSALRDAFASGLQLKLIRRKYKYLPKSSPEGMALLATMAVESNVSQSQRVDSASSGQAKGAAKKGAPNLAKAAVSRPGGPGGGKGKGKGGPWWNPDDYVKQTIDEVVLGTVDLDSDILISGLGQPLLQGNFKLIPDPNFTSKNGQKPESVGIVTVSTSISSSMQQEEEQTENQVE